MYARVGRYEVPLDRLDEDIRQAHKIDETVRQIPGNKGLYYFVDRVNGQTMSMSLWESEEALRASETQAIQLREQLVQPTGGRIVSVERYEIVLMPTEMRGARAA